MKSKDDFYFFGNNGVLPSMILYTFLPQLGQLLS